MSIYWDDNSSEYYDCDWCNNKRILTLKERKDDGFRVDWKIKINQSLFPVQIIIPKSRWIFKSELKCVTKHMCSKCLKTHKAFAHVKDSLIIFKQFKPFGDVIFPELLTSYANKDFGLDHESAMKVIDKLVLLDPDVGTVEANALEALTILIEKYEDKHYNFEETEQDKCESAIKLTKKIAKEELANMSKLIKERKNNE